MVTRRQLSLMFKMAHRRLNIRPWTLIVLVLVVVCFLIYITASMFDAGAGPDQPNKETTLTGRLETWLDHSARQPLKTRLSSLFADELDDVTTPGPEVMTTRSLTALDRVMSSPPDKQVPLNLTISWPVESSKLGWPSRIIDILDYKKGGFFVEYNANDGETPSNTLMLERQYGWTGLLIESDLQMFQSLVYKRRQVYLAHVCLNKTPEPGEDLEKAKHLKRKGNQAAKRRKAPIWYVQCYDLHTLLEHTERRPMAIDYLSLDIQGGELEVLKAIAWDKVTIWAITVHVSNDDESKYEMTSYMKERGYYMHEYLRIDENEGSFLFITSVLDLNAI